MTFFRIMQCRTCTTILGRLLDNYHTITGPGLQTRFTSLFVFHFFSSFGHSRPDLILVKTPFSRMKAPLQQGNYLLFPWCFPVPRTGPAIKKMPKYLFCLLDGLLKKRKEGRKKRKKKRFFFLFFLIYPEGKEEIFFYLLRVCGSLRLLYVKLVSLELYEKCSCNCSINIHHTL